MRNIMSTAWLKPCLLLLFLGVLWPGVFGGEKCSSNRVFPPWRFGEAECCQKRGNDLSECREPLQEPRFRAVRIKKLWSVSVRWRKVLFWSTGQNRTKTKQRMLSFCCVWIMKQVPGICQCLEHITNNPLSVFERDCDHLMIEKGWKGKNKGHSLLSPSLLIFIIVWKQLSEYTNDKHEFVLIPFVIRQILILILIIQLWRWIKVIVLPVALCLWSVKGLWFDLEKHSSPNNITEQNKNLSKTRGKRAWMVWMKLHLNTLKMLSDPIYYHPVFIAKTHLKQGSRWQCSLWWNGKQPFEKMLFVSLAFGKGFGLFSCWCQCLLW